MRALHVLASSYGQRPSAMVGIRNRAAAYQFDLSVLTIAHDLDDQDRHSGKGKDRGRPMGDVRTLARGPIKRVKIPADGIW